MSLIMKRESNKVEVYRQAWSKLRLRKTTGGEHETHQTILIN